jgi:ATP-dependent 26S proteasome regulatory subunit
MRGPSERFLKINRFQRELMHCKAITFQPDLPTELAGRGDAEAAGDYYANSFEHLLAELERIDLLIQAQVSRSRQLHKTDEQFQGLVISEQEVDELLARPTGTPRFANSGSEGWEQVQGALARLEAQIALRKATSRERGVHLRLAEIENLFGLTPFDVNSLLICLAPELDLRYERLYAYLQDDVTKKRPSVDLVLNLLCPSFEAKLSGRHRFSAGAPLVGNRLLQLFEDPAQQQAPLLGKYLRVDERVASYLLGSDELDARLLPYLRLAKSEATLDDLILSPEMKTRLTPVFDQTVTTGGLLYFQGASGVGKRTTAEALCKRAGIGLLTVDTELLAGLDQPAFDLLVKLAARESLLQNSALYSEGFGALLAEDKRPLLNILLSELQKFGVVSFLAGDNSWEPSDRGSELRFQRVEFSRPDSGQRAQLWEAALRSTPRSSDLDAQALANAFRLTAGQIRSAALTAKSLARWRDPEGGQVTTAEIYEGCRLHSSRKLSTLGRKIKPHHTWSDIVLPDDRLRQLQEICNSMKYRSVVYDQWGFDRKLSLGKGLNVLFAGPSGTGKTMAAGIMAGELGLDLYKIDLSTIVSKYIGETEKNLARIFAEAESSNAILFFDEADALFGKRSEVRDSHDRYANIEINYLLQKMEEHEGVAILATNFRKNMDDAFVRRMHFTVEFPFPNEADRRRIWQGIWPAETPQSAELDLDFMAHRFEIAGGNIRNIALSAAFLAASDGGVVSMAHLLHSTKREYQKMGKVVMQGEFE